jgi:hypothetical protein
MKFANANQLYRKSGYGRSLRVDEQEIREFVGLQFCDSA